MPHLLIIIFNIYIFLIKKFYINNKLKLKLK